MTEAHNVEENIYEDNTTISLNGEMVWLKKIRVAVV
jgi:hypothetical protein